MTVKNINGTTDNPTCPCGSWIKHWEKYTGLPALGCAEIHCTEQATVDSHVQKQGEDRSWYIVPLCKTHNGKHGQELRISDNVNIIPVTVRHKCGL